MHHLVFVACLPVVGCSFLGLHASEQHILGQPVPIDSVDVPAVKSLALVSIERLMSFVRSAPAHEHKSPTWGELTDAKAFGLMSKSEIFGTFVIWLILYFSVAAYYQTNVRYYAPPAKQDKVEKSQENNFKDHEQFRFGLFECFKHGDVAFWSCCCPGIRWADTMSKLGIMRFWPAFCFLTSLYCLSFIPIATICCYLVVVGYMAYHRQELRAKFNFEDQGTGACVSDCFTYMFCMSCAVAQDALQTREATRVDHPAIVRDHSNFRS